MENQRLHSDLRNKFQDLESPFNDRVSFDAVMKKRERKKRRVIFWIPSFAVVAGLFIASGMGLLWLNTDSKAEKSPKVSIAKVVYKGGKKRLSTQIRGASLRESENVSESSSTRLLVSEGAESTYQQKRTSIAKSNGSQKAGISIVENTQRLDLAKFSETLGQLSPSNLAQVVSESIASSNKNIEILDAKNSASTQYSFLYSELLCDPQGIENECVGFVDGAKDFVEIPEGEYEGQWDPELLKSKWYSEFSATTGSRVVLNFNEDDRLSVLGTMYHANYHALLLKDIGNGLMLGAGLSYGEFIGNGEWRLREFEEKTTIDSYDMVVMIPPVQTVRVYDTTVNQVRTETIGEISYRIDKISIPLAVRYNFMLGKTEWRAAAQFNPGLTLKTSGSFFGKTEFTPIQQQKMLSMDVKIGVGPAISIYKDWTLILEPNLMYHSFRDQVANKTRSKTLTGFGVSVLHRF